MRFALHEGQRREAQPKLVAQCPGCGATVIAKCGEIKTWHWAHAGTRTCDPWWENESDWHRAWKNHFPLEWQEVVHRAPSGELHIADVKTAEGWVLEFQHSHIEPDERRAREQFYEGLVWVVDGARRTRDRARFAKEWARGTSYIPNFNKRQILKPAGALFRDWVGSAAHVIFDLGDGEHLWWVYPHSSADRAYVQPVSRSQFVRTLAETGLNGFESLIDNFRAFVAHYEEPPPLSGPRSAALPPQRPLVPFGRPRIRRHFRF